MHMAHIREDGKIQTAAEHSRSAAEFAAKSLRPIGMGTTAFLAALLHDFGKFKEEYDRYLEEAVAGTAVRGSVNHTFAGVRFVLEQWHSSDGIGYDEVTAELLAYAIGAHHGLFDCMDARQNSGFQHRQKKEGIGYAEARSDYLEQCADLEELNLLFRESVQETTVLLNQMASLSQQQDDEEANRETAFYVGLLQRMLLSAVIEGDRRDTAQFMNADAFPKWPEDMRGIWADRLAFMEQKLGTLPREQPIDQARHTISDTCASFARQSGGVYRLNVPTGGGKTLSALRFALTHAKQWNKTRIIFTSPLLSILDQNAGILRRFIGDDSLILEHHSNLAEPENKPERLRELELLTDTWEAPVIITTLVQLLNTCFSGKTSAIRRFHSLCNSIIILDEVQTVPNKMLTLFNLTVNFLSEICGATIVLCSATQPSLEKVQHPLKCTPPEMVPWQGTLWSVFKRTEIQNAGQYRLREIPQLIEQVLSDCDSLLVVCNRKDEAAFLLEELRNAPCRRFHLSAAMCQSHRQETLHSLQAALETARSGGEKVLCISTQVIEAGVDISFQQVIRLAAGMDSVVQAAGRCNRHAESRKPAPVRIVLCADERLEYLEDIDRGKKATVSLLSAFADHPEWFQNDLSGQKAIGFYYHQLYGSMNPGYQDDVIPEYGSVYRLLADNPKFANAQCPMAACYYLRQAFQLAGKLFQVFDENTTDILVPYGKGRDIREYLISAAKTYGERDWQTIRRNINEAKKYSVSVYQHQFAQLEKLGAVMPLFEDSVYVLSDGFYDENIGLSIQKGKTGFQGV